MSVASPLLAVYDDRLRGRAEVASATWSRPLGPAWLAGYGTHGLLTTRSLAGLDRRSAAALVEQAAAAFAEQGRVVAWEWKTRGHDVLDDGARLEDVLGAAGLRAEEVETVMLGEAADLDVPVALPPGVGVLRADVGGQRERWVARAAALQRAVFGGGPTDSEVLARLEDNSGTAGLWVAAVGDQVVATGRLEVVPGTGCAGLWGGCTDPAWRGRGLYRALVAARAAWARTQGVRHLHSDCTAMSRPVLERAGLVAVTTTTPWVAQVPPVAPPAPVTGGS